MNHLGQPITTPYIQQNSGCTPSYAQLVWQDEKNLVKTSTIEYVDNLYGPGKGGIRFQIGDIKQGNAVIAIKDAAGTIMWSWHIWVTRFDFDETITVTGHNKEEKYNLMTMNLGWCSNGETIKKYDQRYCQVKFVSTYKGETLERTVTFVQKPHLTFPKGNAPYYQWGRKDPFVGSNQSWTVKAKYLADGSEVTWYSSNIDDGKWYEDDHFNDKGRKTTREALPELIKNPDNWHRPPGEGTEGSRKSKNETYSNLWKANNSSSINTIKTVYDPCPVGYQVPHRNAFSSFTISGTGWGGSQMEAWNNVKTTATYDITKMEFYTNWDKYESITFPCTGYRDWDASGGDVLRVGWCGYIWAAGHYEEHACYNFEFAYSYDGVNTNDVNRFLRNDNKVFGCDGFPIRPCVYENHGTSAAASTSARSSAPHTSARRR